MNMPNAVQSPQQGGGFSPLGGQPIQSNINDPQQAMAQFQQQLRDPQFQDFVAEQAAMEMEPPDMQQLEQEMQLTQSIQQPMPATGGARGAPPPPDFSQASQGFDPYLQIAQQAAQIQGPNDGNG